MKKRIPKRLNNDPILESVVELRFETDIPTDAIFGLVYSKFQEVFSKHEALGILQLPEMVRKNDKSLEFAPHHKFSNDQFQINLGPKVIAIINQKPYIGWDEYRKIIQKIISDLVHLNFISSITRIGIRYIDFFGKQNIFDNLEFSINDFPFQQTQTQFSTNFQNGKFETTLQVSNSHQILIDGKKFSGSILDLDTYVDYRMPFSEKSVIELIDEAHEVEKELFYNLLKDEFIKILDPEYD